MMMQQLPSLILSRSISVSSNVIKRFIKTCPRLNQANNNNDSNQNIIKVSHPVNHVAHIELNRPEVKNAFSVESSNKLVETINQLDNDKSIRCVILSGSGQDLTSGIDLKSFLSAYGQLQEIEDQGRRGKLLLSFIEKIQEPFKRMFEFSKPIICVVHGLCYGLGVELAACSDIRYCSKDSKIAIREVLIGIAADVGSLQEMPRIVSNQSLLRELIYTGRDMTYGEAKELGLVSKVCDSKELTIEAAIKTATCIANRSPVAIQGTKRNLRFSRDKPFSVGLDYNAVWNMTMLQSTDVNRAVEALLTRSDKVDYDPY